MLDLNATMGKIKFTDIVPTHSTSACCNTVLGCLFLRLRCVTLAVIRDHSVFFNEEFTSSGRHRSGSYLIERRTQFVHFRGREQSFRTLWADIGERGFVQERRIHHPMFGQMIHN